MKVNQLKAGVLISYFSNTLGNIISMIYTPIMLRLLGQSEYGLYNLVSSVVSYLGLFNFGFSSAYMRFYSRYKVKDNQEKIDMLNGMFLIIYTAIGFICIIVGIALVNNIEFIFGNNLTTNEYDKTRILMIIMILNMAISFPTSIFSSNIVANEEYIFQKLVQMIRIIFNPFVMIPVLLAGYGSIGMVIVTTFINIMIEISNMIFCFKKLKLRFSLINFDFELMKEMALFSSYIFIGMVTDQINWNVDKFLLGRYKGTVAVAEYGLAAQLNNYYISLSLTISSVFTPRIHRIVSSTNDNRELTNLLTRVGRIQFILLSLICSGFVFLGQPFIKLWAGTEYSISYIITLILIIPVSIPSIQNLGLEILKAKNMHKFRSIVYLFIAIGNFILSISLTKMYGGIGAATGTAISLLLGNGVAMNWFYHRKVGLDMKYFWSMILRIIPSLLISITLGILIFNFIDINSILLLLLSGFIYTVIYCLSTWFLAMNKYEKELIIQPLSRIIRKVRR